MSKCGIGQARIVSMQALRGSTKLMKVGERRGLSECVWRGRVVWIWCSHFMLATSQCWERTSVRCKIRSQYKIHEPETKNTTQLDLPSSNVPKAHSPFNFISKVGRLRGIASLATSVQEHCGARFFVLRIVTPVENSMIRIATESPLPWVITHFKTKQKWTHNTLGRRPLLSPILKE